MRKYAFDSVRVHKRRRLPHWDVGHGIYFVTFRLFDAIPLHVIRKLAGERDLACRNAEKLRGAERDAAVESARREYRRRVERLLDGSSGACFLLRPDVATVVDEALHFFDDERYRLLAWSLMPNHVHAAYEGFDEWPLETVMHSWKSYTGSHCNGVLKRSGPFWDEEYFDRVVRDSRELEAVVRYILSNPEKAGLTDWSWSGIVNERVTALL